MAEPNSQRHYRCQVLRSLLEVGHWVLEKRKRLLEVLKKESLDEGVLGY